MDEIKVNFVYTLENDLKRVIQTANDLSNYFFQNHHFLVLPQLPPHTPENVVYFPDLDYHLFPNFWSQVKKLYCDTPPQVPFIFFQKFSQKYQHNFPHSTLITPLLPLLKSQWQHYGPQFLHRLFDILPQYRPYLRSINIYLTNYGTICSFNRPTPKQPTLNIYLRQDGYLYHIFEAIVSALLYRHLIDQDHYSWEEFEAITDFLLRQTSLNLLPKTIQGTLRSLRQTPTPKLVTQSNLYLARLGLLPKSPWRTQNQHFYYHNQPLHHLTSKEMALLHQLITISPAPLTYDQIDPNSLYAATKLIQRLRTKLTLNNLPSNLIRTHRRLGYSL
jgi:hypothetical protein